MVQTMKEAKCTLKVKTMTNKERYTAIRKAQFRVMNEWLKVKKELQLEDLTLYDLLNWSEAER